MSAQRNWWVDGAGTSVPQPGRMVVLGAGESGLGAARLAARLGWSVLLSDAGPIDPERAEQARKAGVELEESGHAKAMEAQPDLVVKSPGHSTNSRRGAGFCRGTGDRRD